jgi:uncharacterized membrane protein HdeD (DUF308 family)
MSIDDNRRPQDGANIAHDPAHAGAKPAELAPGGFAWSMFADNDPIASRAMSDHLARNWWAVLLRGLFAILFGIVALVLPGVTLASLVLLFAVYMLVDGVFDIVAAARAARHGERWGALIFEGIADLVAAAIAFFLPLATVLAFVVLMAAWAIISGVLLVAAAVKLHRTHGKWLMGFGGVVSVIWGVLLLVEPIIGALVLTWWMGAYALFFGGALIALAFQLRSRAAPPGTLPQHA